MYNPLVSVIIPVYNNERFIAEAVDSVLAQTYRPIEIIVVDDGSDDNTAKIVNSYTDITYIFQENQGHGKAKNTGIQAARGAFLAFLDSDDLWASNKIQTQVDYLRKHPKTGYVVCNMKNFIQPGCPSSDRLKELYPEDEVIAFIPSALLVRREVFEEIGTFNPEMRRANDVDLIFRFKDKGIQMANVNELLLFRRIHESNLSHQRQIESRAIIELFQAVRRSVHRKQNPGTNEETSKFS